MKERPELHGNTEGMEWLGSWGGQERRELRTNTRVGLSLAKTKQGKSFW